MQERFDQRLRGIPAAATHALVIRVAQIESFRGWWEGIPKPAAPLERRILAATAAESAAESTRIAAGASPAEEAGYAEALRSVFDGYAGMPPSEGRLLALHAAIFRNSPAGRLHAGRYKTAAAASRRWNMEPPALRAPAPLLVPAQMETLTAWFSSRIGGGEFHPLLVVASYVLEFLAIRPFSDGNRRMGRLLTNLLLLRCGHGYLRCASLEKAVLGIWSEYYLALRKSQASRNQPRPDISPWLLAFLDSLIVQQRSAREEIGRLPDETRLSENQMGVLAIAARDGEVTNRKAAAELGIARETAKQTLNRLAALGALRRSGFGRATRYRLPERG
ncbi:MAG: Fic family protein [Thermodesulfobacteriota bacterium]